MIIKIIIGTKYFKNVAVPVAVVAVVSTTVSAVSAVFVIILPVLPTVELIIFAVSNPSFFENFANSLLYLHQL